MNVGYLFTIAANLAEDLVFLRPVKWRNEGTGRVRWQPQLHDGRRLWQGPRAILRRSYWLYYEDVMVDWDNYPPALFGWVDAWKKSRLHTERERKSGWHQVSL